MKVLLLGATGSIGKQLIKVLGKHTLVGISFNHNIKLAQKIINKFNLKYYYCSANNNYSSVKNLDELIRLTKPNLVVNAIVGIAGLKATIATINHKIDLALANKESLVMAGKFITQYAKKNHLNILPIDSEHSALYELIKISNKPIKEIIITCSGGSTYFKSKEELIKIKYDEVVKHPNWNMGNKISIDSATLINKCFEIIEAYWLFNNKNIKAILHPQSIVHGIVRYEDESYQMYASFPSMLLPISLAINYYRSSAKYIKPINFKNLSLTFDEINQNHFLPIKWAYNVINDKNNCLGTIINAANELAIKLFRMEKITFLEIIPFINYYISKHKNEKIQNIDDIFYLLDKILSSDYEQAIQNIRSNKIN